MAEELENKELNEEQIKDEVKDEVVEEQTAEQVTEEEQKEEIPQEEVVEEKEKVDEVKSEGQDEEEAQKEEPAVEEDNQAASEPEAAEEVHEEKEEKIIDEETEKQVEEKEAPLPQIEAEEVVDVEEVKKQLAEKEAELEEEKAIKSYENDVREANRQLDDFLVNLGNAMAQEFAKYGIDVNTNLDELKKTDPAKAQVAENIIRQAQEVKAHAMNNVQNNLNDRLTDVVFGKASRLFDKYELTNEQGQVAAETFVNILSQSGIRDMGDDLIAKVELAVARAKMIKPKAEKVIDDVKEVVKETVEAVKDVIEAKAPSEAKAEPKVEEKVEESKAEEVKEEEEALPAVESVVEAPTLDEFKEGAVTSNQAAGDAVTIDNVLDKMTSLPFKERVRFYAEHKELAEEAMAKKSNAESRRKRI